MTDFIDPDDRDLSILCTGELRKVYGFYLRAARYSVPEAEIEAHLVRLSPVTPIEWIEAIKAIRTPCRRCRNGTYYWGAVVNGRPSRSGRCFQCNGKGYQTMSDFRRNRGYNRHAIERALA